MAQRPVGPFTIHRVARTPENPPTDRTGGSNPSPDSVHVVWRDPEPVDRPETDPAPAVPAGGGRLPDTSGGRVCPKCWAYAIDPDGHAEWHVKLDRWVAGVSREMAAIQRIFQQGGYLHTVDGTTTTDGNTDDA